MKKIFIISLILLSSISTPVWAHFGMVIPSDTMIMPGESSTVNVQISFSHPFELIGMDQEKPTVSLYGPQPTVKDLSSNLKKTSFLDHQAWNLSHNIRFPGGYWLVMEPKPYWEPMEDCYIIHLTKTMISAFGDEEGWDRELGLKTEIVPLTKPYGLYTGNLFQGVVKFDGKPVPYAEVEIEYYNEAGKAKAPTELMITQTVKADGNGVFSYAVPSAGWWGFAALNEADYKLKHNNQEKSVELGAVIWVKFHPWSVQ